MFTVKYLNIKLKMEYKNIHSNNLARFSNLGNFSIQIYIEDYQTLELEVNVFNFVSSSLKDYSDNVNLVFIT